VTTLSSIPVLALAGRLVVSLQGDITDSQMTALTGAVLDRIRDNGALAVVIDASGVWSMDSHLCAMLGKLAASVRLMGARVVLSGLSPGIVMTLQEMDIVLDGIATAIDLESALELTGLALVEHKPPEESELFDVDGELFTEAGQS
jgi:rsbT antagonist protein RsbS